MPPRRANRHRNVEALYRREEAELMEQRINEKFDEGIEKLEKLMNDLNQTQRRRSPNSNHGGNRVSPSVTEARRVSPHSLEIEEKHQFHHGEIIMTMDMKREEVNVNLTMRRIEMKRDIVEEACMNEGMIRSRSM